MWLQDLLLVLFCCGLYIDASKIPSPPLKQPAAEIPYVGLSHAANYQSTVLNKLGSISDNVKLIIKRQTYITNEPVDYEVLEGLPAVFMCSAESDDGELNIEWLKNGNRIDYNDLRLTMLNDNSLQISNTNVLDSGEYTCVASTDFHAAKAKAVLRVQSVPNPPKLLKVECDERDVLIFWEPQGDNNAEILYYKIQASSSFTPNEWDNPNEIISTLHNNMHYVTMSPWANYTFRVLAFNKVGQSIPSNPSIVCISPPDVPYTNPEDVEGKGSNPNNMVIRWRPMPEHKHNGPNFFYRVWWKKDYSNEWSYTDVNDWTKSTLVVMDTPVYQKYNIKVGAMNDHGPAIVLPLEMIGYSGEDEPTAAPENLTVIQVVGPEKVLFGWTKVTTRNVNGQLKGYKIELWKDNNTTEKVTITINRGANRVLISGCAPSTNYFAHVMVFNGRYNGPPSNVVSFRTLDGPPEMVEQLEATPLGSNAFWLNWKPSRQRNDLITGYKIYFSEVQGTQLGPKLSRNPQIVDPQATSARLNFLKPDTKYRIQIQRTSNAGDGPAYFIEAVTRETFSVAPETPNFTSELIKSDNEGYGAIKVYWRPSGPDAGSHFMAKYRKKNSPNWVTTDIEVNEDYLVISFLDLDSIYEVRVIAVNGEYTTESESQFIEITRDVDQ